MKKFCTYIVGGIVLMLILMTVLDFVYTTIYETSYPRTKFQYLRSLKDKKVNYIFIGSSRVENGIIPAIIEKKTGKTAVNFGFQAARLSDIYTLLQLVKEYNIHYDTLFIQVDYIYNFKEGHSNIFEYEMVPFIRENAVTKAYSDHYAENPIAAYYIPFYRYCSNDLKIGFREIFGNIVRKKTNVIVQKGYVPRFGNSAELTGGWPAVFLNTNATLDSIQSFIKENKIKAVFYCAPVSRTTKNHDFIVKLQHKIPGYKDFSRTLTDDTLFIDNKHLNDDGAKRFTEIFTAEMLMK
jgi:hypothetical protein